MQRFSIIILAAALLFTSCKSTLPTTTGDPLNAVSYGYQPLDPLPVDVKINDVVIDPLTQPEAVLNALSDETIRLVTGEVTASGRVAYGTASMGYKGHSYEVIIDYMKFQTYGKPFKYSVNGRKTDVYLTTDSVPQGTKFEREILPLYIGIGLRLKASITVNEGKVNLGNLFSIGMAASAGKVTGTLVVQTLGISGKDISGLVPMPTEISAASIQSAITAVSTIKTKIYDPDTRITPRTIGFYNVLGGGTDIINELITDCLQGNAVLNLFKK